MTHIEFGQMLRDIVNKYDISINNAIRKTNINRSTFYKFLSGVRIPTDAQVREIIESLQVTDEDAKALAKAYEDARFGPIAWRNHEIVRECLQSVADTEFAQKFSGRPQAGAAPSAGPSEGEALASGVGAAPLAGPSDSDALASGASGSDSVRIAGEPDSLPASGLIRGKNTVSSTLIHFLHLSSLLQGDDPVDVFLPLDATHLLTRYSDQFSNPQHPVRFLFHFSDSEDDLDRHSAPKFHDLIPLALAVNSAVHFFYGPGNLIDGLGLLFPYYVLSPQGALFLTVQLDNACLTRDAQLVAACRSLFESRFAVTDEITHRGKNLATVQQQILESVQTAAGQHLYLIDPTPCMSLIATKELLEESVPEDMREPLWQYCRTIQSVHPVEIVSPDGLRRMVETRHLSECGIHVTVPKEAVHLILLALKERLGKTFFLSNSAHVQVPENWGVSVIPNHSVVLVPYADFFDTVQLSEKNVIAAFSAAFEQNMEYFVLSTKAAGRMLDHFIEETA